MHTKGTNDETCEQSKKKNRVHNEQIGLTIQGSRQTAKPSGMVIWPRLRASSDHTASGASILGPAFQGEIRKACSCGNSSQQGWPASTHQADQFL